MTETPNAQAVTEDFEFAALALAKNYRAALLREFSPFLRGRVLEIGAGIGQFTEGLAGLPTIEDLMSVEPEARFCERFRQLQPGRALTEGTIEAVPAEQAWDGIVSVNVLEHISNDEEELARYRQRLAAREGHVCLFVPARPEIYAPLDRDFGHFRRYTRPELRGKLERAGFRIVALNYFNIAGYFGWWLNFCLLKQRSFNAGSIIAFDRVIFPIVHAVEYNLLRPPFGQSLLAIARA